MKSLTVTPINLGKLRFDLSDIYDLPADHAWAGQIAKIPMRAFHITLPGRSALVDAVSYDIEEISASLEIPGYAPPPPLLEQLREHGIDADEITDVIITHAHFDHYGALGKRVGDGYEPAFPNARHYLGKADWQPEHFDAFDERTLGLAERRGLLNLVEGEVDLGEGLALLPTPGETAGHQALQVQAGEQSLYFAGDLYHHPLEFADAAANVSWADLEAMQASKAGLMRRAATSGGRVYFTHIEGAWRVAVLGDGTLVWQRQ